MCKKQILIIVAAVALCASTNVSIAQDAGLVGWWKFEEAAGALEDQSNNNNDGTTVNGVLYQQPGQIGYALGFDGTNDYVTVGSTGRPTDTFSFGGWFKIEATHEIEGEATSGTGGTANQRYAFDPQHGGDLNGGAGLSLGTNGISVYEHGSGYMPATAVYQAEIGTDWNHIMIVYDNKRPTIYLNGTAVRTGLTSPRQVVNAPIRLGGMAYGYYKGLMDEIRIYNRALSADEVEILAARMKAWGPTPSNGGLLLTKTSETLFWKAGDWAASHNVYFGTNLQDVENGTGDTFQLNKDQNFFIVGLPDYAYPEGLVPGTTYYWRIDEVNDLEPDSPWKGEVWSFSIPGSKAHYPIPADGSAFVATDVTLSWTGGFGAILHTVYFGEDYDTVANASGGGFQTAMTYDPPELEFNKTYYWRVDEFGDEGALHPGDVWSFTATREGLGELVAEGWDGDIAIDDLRSLIDSTSRAPDLVQILPNGFDITPNLDNFGARVYGWLYAPATGDFTFWLCTDDNGRLYLSHNQDPENMVEIARETGWSAPNTFNQGEEQSAPIALVAGERYYIEAIWQEGTGGDHCQVAWAGPAIGDSPTIIASSYVSPFDPVKAYGESPADGAVDVKQSVELAWKPGNYAVSHNVYLGTDPTAVATATTGSPQFRGATQLGVESFGPSALSLATTYYWRIDEVNNLHPDSPWKGAVWSFTTADWLVIDDFENYNDTWPNRVFDRWVDGTIKTAYGNSQIGYWWEQADLDAGAHFLEDGTVRSGDWSAPYLFNGFSEARLPMPQGLRNWTQEDVKRLSLWYYGYPASQGSFVQTSPGVYEITAAGGDIWNVGGVEADEFHYAWKTLQGSGSITALVSAPTGTNMNAWVKAGVMIRDTLEPESAHAFMCLTNTQGIAFQYRPSTSGASQNFDQRAGEADRPKWLRLEKDLSNNFTAYHANDLGGLPDKWTAMTPMDIQMASPVYIGLALTSHQRYVTATATFSEITTTGNVSTDPFTAQDIGIRSNPAQQMYVTLEDGQGRTATVNNPDPNAAQVAAWTEWGEYGQGIRLDAFVADNPNFNLADVNSMLIGFGAQPTGSGLIYFDDIRLYRPKCVPEMAKPAADFNNDCVVDMRDLEILAGDWLIEAYDVTVQTAGDTNLEAQYSFEGNLLDGSGNGYTGDPNGAVAYVAGITGQALDLDGATYVNVAGYAGVTGTGDRTCAAWIRTTELGEIVSWGQNTAGQKWIFRVQDNNGSAGAIRVEVSGGYIVGNTDVRDGAWHHVAAVLEAAPTAAVQNVNLYVDGIREYISAVKAVAIDTAETGVVRVGEAPWHNRPFTGQIDEVRIYSRAVPQAEIANLAGIAVGTTYHQPLTSLLNTTEDTDVMDDEKIDFKDYAALIDAWLDELLWP